MLIRNRLVPIGAFLLALFMVAIVWANYNSQVELRDASLKQFHDSANREGAALAHFFSERRNNLEDLSESREIRAYYENKALGMSMEYGLWASLVGIGELFDRSVRDKMLDGVPIYKRILYVDAADGPLADNEGVVEGAESVAIPDLSRASCLSGRICMFFQERHGDAELVLAQPFVFKKRRVGTIVAWINTKAALSLVFGHNDVHGPGQSGETDFLVSREFIYSPVSKPPRKLIDLHRAGKLPEPGRVLAVECRTVPNAATTYLLTSANIDETPFRLLHIAPEQRVLGDLKPWQLLLFTILLAALLLGGGGAILWMSAKNLVLNVRVEESSKYARRMEERNETLAREVRARTEAEAALTRLNEELEGRVRKRTSDLAEQAQTLQREVAERRETEATLRTIFNNTNDAIIIHGANGRIIDANDRMLDLYQVARGDLKHLSIADDLSCLDAESEPLLTKWKRAARGEDIPPFEFVARHPGDGSCFDVEAAICRIELDGHPVILTSIHDISAQKKVLLQQAEHQAFLNTVFEGLGAAIFVFNPAAGRMVDCNAVSEKMLSLTKDEIISRSCDTPYSLSAGGKDLLCPDWDDRGSYAEFVLSLPDEEPFPISRYLFDINIGGQSHLVQVVFNITKRKNLERTLSIAQKLESIGLLAAGIAHEINTPTQYIGDSVQFVRNAFQDIARLIENYEKALGEARLEEKGCNSLDELHDFKEEMGFEFIMEEAPKACEMALDGVERVATIVSAMKKFAHPGEEVSTAIDLNEAIENTVTVARNEWKYVAEIEMSLDRNLPSVQCFPGSMNQVLLNLIVNAAHAMEKGTDPEKKGRITVSTRHLDGTVEIRVADTGCGIAPEHLQKVFDPFFTTKEVGKGTGQGLAIVHDIVVHKHGGVIEVESELGKGTTFTVSLPVRQPDEEAARPA